MPLSQPEDSLIHSRSPHPRALGAGLLPALLLLALPACTRLTPGFCMIDTDCMDRAQYCSLPAMQCSSNISLHALLSGDQVVPPTASQATGDFLMVINDVMNSGHYTINLNFAPPASNSTPSALDIRAGQVGQPAQGGTAFAHIPVTGPHMEGDLEMTVDLLAAMRTGGYYAVAFSNTFQNGEIRGQIYSLDPADAAQTPVHLQGILSGEESAPGVPSMGSGTVKADLMEATGQLSLTYTVMGLGGTINGFHVHRGGFNVNGDIIYTLPTPGAGSMGDTVQVGIDQVQAPQAHLFGLLLKSGLSYLNVHTTAFAAGEVRAQLLPPSPTGTYPVPFNITLAHATNSGAIGEAEMYLSADRTVTPMLAYRISHTGITTPMAAMLVRGATVLNCPSLAGSGGANGAQGYCNIDPNPAAGAVGSTTITMGDLTGSGLNFVVTSAAFPTGTGELHGQVIVPK